MFYIVLLFPDKTIILCKFEGEIEVFTLEHGLQRVHTIHKLLRCNDLTEKVTLMLEDAKLNNDTLTIVFWGHGNKIDNATGYLKIFSNDVSFQFLFINDLLKSLLKLSQDYKCTLQFLMTQCWAHCHDTTIHSECDNLMVDWLTSDSKPETSARRWDLLKTNKEMDQSEFDTFTSNSANYDSIEISTKLKYKNSLTQLVLLKYLNYASIHVEATLYIFLQRDHKH